MTARLPSHPSRTTVSRMRHLTHLPRLVIADGSLEALKWLGLTLMVLDHVNKYLLGGKVAALFALGRLAMPIFAIVLAYNLARPGAFDRGVHARLMRRLATTGLLASFSFIALGGLGWGWWPINIMGTLLVATCALYFVERGGAARLAAACGVLLVGGLFVEYWWPALAIVVGAWSYFRRPGWFALVGCVAGLACLQPINHNGWAFATIPIVLLATRIDVPLPRMSRVFYNAYPLHLALIWLMRQMA